MSKQKDGFKQLIQWSVICCALILWIGVGQRVWAESSSTALGDFHDLSRVYEALKMRREAQIEHLRTYAQTGQFPKNTNHLNAYRPYFVDVEQTPCAVGYLMQRSGLHKAVQTISKNNNQVRVPDVNSGPLIEWVLDSGLTQEECALIQPNYAPPTAADRERTRLARHFQNVISRLEKSSEDSLEAALRRKLGHAIKAGTLTGEHGIALVESLDDKHPNVRIGAAYALANLKPEVRPSGDPVRSGLVKAMKDSDEKVRFWSCVAVFKQQKSLKFPSEMMNPAFQGLLDACRARSLELRNFGGYFLTRYANRCYQLNGGVWRRGALRVLPEVVRELKKLTRSGNTLIRSHAQRIVKTWSGLQEEPWWSELEEGSREADLVHRSQEMGFDGQLYPEDFARLAREEWTIPDGAEKEGKYYNIKLLLAPLKRFDPKKQRIKRDHRLDRQPWIVEKQEAVMGAVKKTVGDRKGVFKPVRSPAHNLFRLADCVIHSTLKRRKGSEKRQSITRYIVLRPTFIKASNTIFWGLPFEGAELKMGAGACGSMAGFQEAVDLLVYLIHYLPPDSSRLIRYRLVERRVSPNKEGYVWKGVFSGFGKDRDWFELQIATNVATGVTAINKKPMPIGGKAAAPVPEVGRKARGGRRGADARAPKDKANPNPRVKPQPRVHAPICSGCRGKMFTMDVGKCSICPGGTSSGSFKYCNACAARLKRCMAGGKTAR